MSEDRRVADMRPGHAFVQEEVRGRFLSFFCGEEREIDAIGRIVPVGALERCALSLYK